MTVQDKYSSERFAIIWVMQSINKELTEMQVYGEGDPDNGLVFDTFATRQEAEDCVASLDDSWSTDPEECLPEDMFNSIYIVSQIGSPAFQLVMKNDLTELFMANWEEHTMSVLKEKENEDSDDESVHADSLLVQ